MTRPPLPRWLLIAAAVAVLLAALPLAGMAVRVPWTRVPELLTSEAARDAAWLSLRTCAVSTVLCVLLGTPLAVLLSRSRGPLAAVARTLTALPMVLPPVVAGLALLITFGRTGVVGRHLSVLGVEVGFTTAAVVIAQTFVAMPFLVVSLEGALRTAGERYEVVAATLGASPLTALRRVTIPVVLPGLVSGAVLAFARALGEFGATIAFAGNLQGTTQTLPLLIYIQSQNDLDGAVAMSLVLVVVAVLVIVATRTRDGSGVR